MSFKRIARDMKVSTAWVLQKYFREHQHTAFHYWHSVPLQKEWRTGLLHIVQAPSVTVNAEVPLRFCLNIWWVVCGVPVQNIREYRMMDSYEVPSITKNPPWYVGFFFRSLCCGSLDLDRYQPKLLISDKLFHTFVNTHLDTLTRYFCMPRLALILVLSPVSETAFRSGFISATWNDAAITQHIPALFPSTITLH